MRPRSLVLAVPACVALAWAARAVWSRTHRLWRRTTPYGNNLPRPLHARATRAELRHRRVVLIGDVHGCSAELERLLDAVVRLNDYVVIVGDLVNKGPDSPGVLAIVRKHGIRAVRGNHDDQALAAWRAWRAGEPIPKRKKHAWVAGVAEELMTVLKDLPFTLELEGYDATVVHAGLVPGVPLKQQHLEEMYTMRDLVQGDAPNGAVQNGTYIANAVAGTGTAWAEVWQGPQHLIFGHDAARRLQLHPYATGLDTGCVYGGQLTALILPPLDDDGAPWESDAGFLLPEEPGWAQQTIRLKGVEAELVSLQSPEIYSDKFLKLEEAKRKEEAKESTHQGEHTLVEVEGG